MWRGGFGKNSISSDLEKYMIAAGKGVFGMDNEELIG
jgi:hypothetical protein